DYGIDQYRAEMMIHTRAEERCVAVAVLRGAVAEVLHDLVLGDSRREIQRTAQPHRGRHVTEQLFGRVNTTRFEHLPALGVGLRKIAQLTFRLLCRLDNRRRSSGSALPTGWSGGSSPASRRRVRRRSASRARWRATH